MKLIINLKKPIFDKDRLLKFNTRYIYEFDINTDSSINDKFKGGDIFDEINIDDIIIKKEESANITKPDIKYKEVGEINSKLLKQHNIKRTEKQQDIIIFKISKIQLNGLNSLYDIKLILYYLLDIPIENQNLFDKDNISLFYNYSNNITNELLDINIQNILNISNIKYFQNIPIDLDLISNRINYTINTYEKNKYVNHISINKILNLDLVILDDFILNKSSLYNEIEKDDELKIILYKGFIEKYYPYYDINLFYLYLSNENKSLEYPSLNIKSENILLKNEKLLNILKFSNSKHIQQIDKLLTLQYKKLIYHIPSFNTFKILNLRELFNNIELKKIKNLKKIELQLEVQNKNIYFSKHNIYSNNKLLLNEDNIIDNENLYINNKNYNSLVDSIYLQNNILLLVYNINQTTDIYIIINEFFDIYVIYNIIESSKLNKTTIKFNLQYYEDLVLKSLNDLLNDFFLLKLINNKKILNKINIELKLLDKQLIINQNISINTFKKLYSNLSNLELLDYYNILNYDEINNLIELNIKKIKYQTLFNNTLNLLSNNYYNFYTKYELVDKYMKLIYSSHILISNRIKDIKIDIFNTNQEDLYEILVILKYILYLSLDSTKNNNTIDLDSTKLVSKNKLKKLKEIDPILYAINKKNTNNLYSRKCQASQQPDIIDEQEAKKKKHIKYINFTTGEPIYYTCNNKKFPNVKFLTNLHPQNYCIPCCKKKAIEDVKVKSKYISIHNECLTTYKFDKKNKISDEKSRYIMNYSSKTIIENLRLMQIPDSLVKLFNKTYEDLKNPNNKDLKYYILGLNQNIGNIAYVGILHIMSLILNKSINETINYIKNLFIKNSDFINIILDGKLLSYFGSTKDFLIVFTNIFQDQILLSNTNFEFNEWNELFIDICKYLGYINIIFEENENDNSINLLIPPNIRHINEYIFNNESYQYILLLKRTYKNKILYYPIIKTNYSDYYNSNIFYNKTFIYNDQIIKLISQIIKNKLNNSNSSLELGLIKIYIRK